MLSSRCQSYGRSLLKIPKLCEVDRRDRDRYWNNIENTITLPDGSSESENLFLTDAPRVVM